MVLGTERDLADWLVLAATLAAFVTGSVSFLVWIREQFRRPEFEYRWRISPTGDVDGLVDWKADTEGTVPAGATILVESSIRNVGDAAGPTLSNFVVPDCIGLHRFTPGGGDRIDTTAHRSHNPIAGLPDDRSVFFVASTSSVAPGDWWQLRFVVTTPTELPEGASCCAAAGHQTCRLRLLHHISNDRLNRSGQRWFCRWIYALDDEQGDAWPGELPKRGLRRVTANPRGGRRTEVGSRRDLRVIAAEFPAGA